MKRIKYGNARRKILVNLLEVNAYTLKRKVLES
jgi:hypothetical protein